MRAIDMRSELILLILVSVLLSSGSQVLLKLGMSASDIQVVLAQTDRPLQIAASIMTSPLVLAGLVCFGLSALFWLFVLSKIPLSTAYPFVAFGIVITAASGRILLGEQITALKAFGILLIVLGVLAVGSSS
jgi:multidrug transporter EmrE-like cation transporter